jgi:antitoxin component YwqK of YwqJK toxin-antitoxin module
MRVNIDDTDMDDAQRFLYRGALFTGELVETDPAGTVIALTTIRNGIAHGPDRGWYPDGTLRSEIEVVDGRAVGTSREWHPNGRPAEERDFDEHGRLIAVRSWAADGTPTGAGRPASG